MKLYELTREFDGLYEQLDAICDYEPEKDENGNYIDDDGNIIEDVAEYKNNMITAWFDTLEGIEGMFESKAENVVLYIKQLDYDTTAMKAEEKKLTARRKSRENAVESLKKYLLDNMQAIGRKKIETAKMAVSLKNNAPSTIIENEDEFISWAEKNNDSLLKYSKPTISKSKVKTLINSGETVPYAHLESKVSLIIK